MDETTKVLIGTISGFIIAFLAEPVKNYFQHRTKLHNLRIALYKEMVYNYINLADHRKHPLPARHFAEHIIRIECYKNALQNDVSLFYQLGEANDINFLSGALIGRVIEVAREMGKKENEELFASYCDIFAERFAEASYDGRLNTRILRQLLSKRRYEEVTKIGKRLSEKDS